MSKHSSELVRQVRAGFVRQGTSLTAFCRRHAMDPANVRKALQGDWDGPKGRQVRKLVIRAANEHVDK